MDQNKTKNSIKFLQINVDRVKVAHDLLKVTAKKNDIDIVILAEPNNKIATAAGWERDLRNDASIIILNNTIVVEEIAKEKGFIKLRFDKLTLYSCYFSPNTKLDEYKDDLSRLWSDAKTQNGRVLIAGDFNAHSTVWGSKSTDKRGEHLLEILADLDMTVLNVGDRPTFDRGNKTSKIDLTIADRNLAHKIINWKVLQDETMSGHKYITFEMQEANTVPHRSVIGWNYRKIRQERFKELINQSKINTAEELVRATQQACDGSMPRKKFGNKTPAYWWTKEIAEARSSCMLLRRKLTRVHKKNKNAERTQVNATIEAAKYEYKQAKSKLRLLIVNSKEKHWEKVVEDVDRDVWGLGYKIVMKKLKTSPQCAIGMDKIREIVTVLFPAHEPFLREQRSIGLVPKITTEELNKAIRMMKMRKAPGPDEIAPEIVKLACDIIPESIKEVMNDCFETGIFPRCWKTARLILLRKPNKPANDSTGYRPLCLLDCYGKLLERLLLNRLEELIPTHGGLSEAQFGFRKGRSTLDAINKVRSAAEKAKEGKGKKRKLCAMLALDIRNAFNTAPWKEILNEILKRNVPEYMYNLISSYLSDRKISVSDATGQTSIIEVSSGVPQGSILGPTLWNILYDEVLQLDLGEGAELVGFADDLALIITADSEEKIMERGNQSLEKIGEWLRSKRLKLAPEKTEAIMLSGKKRYGAIAFKVENISITPGEQLKYLGVHLDRSLKFNKHIEAVTGKAEKLTNAISRLMPRKAGPRASRRRVLASVAHSVLLYAAPIWSDVLNIAKYREMLLKVQRKVAIRVCGAYRTVSTEAVLVIAGLIPVDKLASERKRCYEGQDTNTKERKATLDKWQEEWKREGKGAWTRELIVDLNPWLCRKFGEVDCWLSQALSGHGVFNAYLFKIGKIESDECSYCGEIDTAKHAIFECRVFYEERRKAKGADLTQRNLVTRMLSSPKEWDRYAEMIRSIMKRREHDELERQRILTVLYP